MPLEAPSPGEKLKLGIRPEHLTLEELPGMGPAPVSPSDAVLQGEVEVLEHLGPRAYLHTRMVDETRLVAQTDGDTQVRIGHQVALRIRSESTHLFNALGKALARPSTP
jgi:multiple sugar transport system ATP-binding protein